MPKLVASTGRPSLQLALSHVLARLGNEHQLIEPEQLATRLREERDAIWLLDARLDAHEPLPPRERLLWLVGPGDPQPEGDRLHWPEQLDQLATRLAALLRAPATPAPAPRSASSEPELRPLAHDESHPRPHRSAAWAEIERRIERLAPHDIPVLILGESGTGKELVAKGLHEASGRGREPFVAVHCGAIPGELLESELFGHERGAFTDAHQRHIGRFEAAGAGTILLDELGEMPIELQAKLLRVLQERRLRRVGGSAELPLRARILAATHRDLRARSARGEFREDLLHRLQVGVIELPPLRERPEDLRLLTELFLRRIAEQTGREIEGLDGPAWQRMLAHDWPGNVRELEHLLRRAVLLGDSPLLGLEALGLDAPDANAGWAGRELRRRVAGGSTPELARQELQTELELAAEKLGITPIRPPKT